ncbi:MAG TPA: hypothetical protein EYN38_10965 [Flavobacteriales bacterium]|nr:hypothetical protein [Flavobacteriales bacterium]HIA10676.1 hypothetical protein [Flavobacteriales bacterium]HIO73612.1 hypothetical protein [Flavobacteriales bacterium]
MNIKYLLLVLSPLVAFMLTACSTAIKDADVGESPATEERQVESVTYIYDHNSTGIYWTAYKHSAKVAVQGIMDSIVVNGAEDSESILELLTNTSFTVYSSSVNSKDPLRDEKIRKFFFGNMSNGDAISGEIMSVLGDESDGDGTLNLKINDLEREVPFVYEVEGETVNIRCTLDFNNWSCTRSLAELHKACDEKHTGEDGKSIFWPTIDVLIETTLKVKVSS